MRLKLENTNQKAFRCCFCCHVRTGTILFGIFVLLLELISLAAFLVMLIHPEVLRDNVLVIPDPELTVSPESNGSYFTYDWIRAREPTSEDRFFAFLLMCGMVTISTMLIYGSVVGRAGYLMPFFCIQVFNFSMTCLSGVGYFSYIPDMKRWLEAQPWIPADWLEGVDNEYLMLICLLSFALVLMTQAYLIGMVWACYKYLVQLERNMAQGVIPIRAYAHDNNGREDTEMLLPPKYEDAIAMSVEEPPPPPYEQN